jgi:dCTP deaminase
LKIEVTGLLAHPQLQQVIQLGYIDALPEHVNAASIDVRLGSTIKREATPSVLPNANFDVKLWEKKASINWVDESMHEEFGAPVYPGEFVLASTVEIFNLPADISGLFILRSSMARNGLEHLQAGWADAGFHDATLTLELQNVTSYHKLWIRPGMRIGQMVMFRHSDSENGSYAVKGKYNGQRGATNSRGGV